ncbi:MAG: alcohol dehydrogenase catalytic domain-containing protein [Candidatus Bathyarchaeia archaeon]
MKAQVLHKPDLIENKPLKFEKYPDPVVNENEVLIRIKACGVCHSNLHVIEGDWQWMGIPAKLPLIPGHEIVGIVEEVGKRTTGFEVGQRAGVQVLYDACGKCEYCLTGREHLCMTQQGTGETVDGGFAELIKVPYLHAYPAPDNMKFEEAAPLYCPGVTAYRAIKRSGVRFGQKIAIFGIGGVGHLSLQFAKMTGAEVIAVDAGDGQLAMAKELGADYVARPEELDNLLSKIGRPEVVAIHVPVQKAIDQAYKVVKRGGTILHAVLGTPLVNFTEEPTIITSVIGTRQEMLEVVQLAIKGKIKVKSKAANLSEANDILLKMKKGEIVGRVALVP